MKHDIDNFRRSSVHEALSRAAADTQRLRETQPFSIRFPKSQYDAARSICERHGTEISTYLRACVEVLLEEYGDPVDLGLTEENE